MTKNSLDTDIIELLAQKKADMLGWSADHRALNMYAILRKDLEMPVGKLVAQAGHAYNMSYEQALKERPQITALYKGTGNGTKLALYSKNLGQLIRAYRDCQEAKLPCALIVDRGHVLPPHFDGDPVITALGIGPVYKDEAAHIIKRYTFIP